MASRFSSKEGKGRGWQPRRKREVTRRRKKGNVIRTKKKSRVSPA